MGTSGRTNDTAVRLAQYRHERPPARMNDTIVTLFSSGHGWTKQGTNGTVNLNDTSDFMQGSQSISMVSDGAGTGASIVVRSTAATGIDLTGQCLRLWVKVTNRANLNSLAVFAFSGSTSNSYTWTWDHGADVFPLQQENCWVPVTLSFANASTAGSPSRSNITQWQVSFSDTGTAATVKLNGIGYFPDGSTLYPNGVLVLNFDDGWDTQATNAAPVLAARGLRATFNVIADRIGQTSYMTLAQLQDLRQKGRHEVACHAYTVANHNLNFVQLLAQQGVQALDDELTNIRKWLLDNGFADGVDILALPNGAYNIDPAGATSVMTEVQKYFAYVRTIYAHQGQYVETLPPSSSHAIRALSGISEFTGGISQAAVSTYVGRVKAQKALGILTFHRITSGAATSTNECALSVFTAIVDDAISQGVEIRTLGDVMRSLDPKMVSKAGADALYVPLTQRGANSGVATLDSSGQVPAGQLGNTTGIPTSTVTTKGDLIAGTASATVARVGVGTDGQVVTALASATAGVTYARATSSPMPADHGMLLWNYAPALAFGAAGAPSSGVMQVFKLYVPYAMTITNVLAITANTPASLTGVYGCLYDSTGTLYAGSTSADQSSTWNSSGAGLRTIPLGAAKAVTAGWIFAAWWFVGSGTNPTFARASGTSTTHNAGQTNTVNSATAYAYATGASSLTTTASGSLSTFNQNGLALWCGAS